ncbi:hypothetical protein ACS0TY_003509 [Phlomoides rotata]
MEDRLEARDGNPKRSTIKEPLAWDIEYADSRPKSCLLNPLPTRGRRGRGLSVTYSILGNVTRQIDHLNYLVYFSDETCKDHIRMTTDCFNRLCYLLQHVGGLRSTRNMSIGEQVAIFLMILSHHSKNRVVKHRFRRSGYTISKHFNSVLNTLLKLHTVLLVVPEPIPDECKDNRWRYFKGCLGALDGTYILVKVAHTDIPRYRNRKGQLSVNVLVVCDRNMNYCWDVGPSSSS